jgi:hypothetical protein
MKKHWEYLKYVLLHKWLVFQECRRLGITWRGIVHDMSKFSEEEWSSYVETFYGHKDKVKANFAVAWLHHKHHNSHHWQFWIGDDNEPLQMPDADVLEMVADWRAMAKARGKGWNAKPWYERNKDKMNLHFLTRERVEAMLSWEALNESSDSGSR